MTLDAQYAVESEADIALQVSRRVVSDLLFFDRKFTQREGEGNELHLLYERIYDEHKLSLQNIDSIVALNASYTVTSGRLHEMRSAPYRKPTDLPILLRGMRPLVEYTVTAGLQIDFRHQRDLYDADTLEDPVLDTAVASALLYDRGLLVTYLLY